MYMICHEDARGMEYDQPHTFDTKIEALEWIEDRPDIKLYPGHALVLYECRQVETLREAPSST